MATLLTAGHTSSVCGQNMIVMECYPCHITSVCPLFQTLYTFCGLGHPETEAYQEGIIICNLNIKTVYFKNNLDQVIHAGCKVKEVCKFDPEAKQMLIVGADQS
eukprot:11360893-Ditylum_brightwellii.AAC.1